MPEMVADPPDLPCYLLFSGDGIEESQRVAPDPLLPRARDARGRFAEGSSGNPRRTAARHPQSQAAGARSSRKAADRAGAGQADRPQAPSVDALGRAILAAARDNRPRRASRDRAVVVAHRRGSLPGVIHCPGRPLAQRNRACRGRAHRPAGACAAALGSAPRTIGAGSRMKRGPVRRPIRMW